MTYRVVHCAYLVVFFAAILWLSCILSEFEHMILDPWEWKTTLGSAEVMVLVLIDFWHKIDGYRWGN